MSFREYMKAGALGLGILLVLHYSTLFLPTAGQRLPILWGNLMRFLPGMGSGFLTSIIWRRRLGPSAMRALMRAGLIAATVEGIFLTLIGPLAWLLHSGEPEDLGVIAGSILFIWAIWLAGAAVAVVIRRADRPSGHEPSPRGEVSERRPVNEGPAP